MAIAVAFTGISNSGKTTLIAKIAEILMQEYKVSIVKHDPKDKAVFDREGKDSFQFFQTGADVVVVSPTRTTLFSHKSSELEKIVSMLDDTDVLLLEGFKNFSLPRICVARDKIDMDYVSFSEALAIDKSIDIKNYALPKELQILDLNDEKSVIEWIFKNGKDV